MATPLAPGDRVTIPLEISGVVADLPGTVVRIAESSGMTEYVVVRLDPEEVTYPADELSPLDGA